MWMLTLPLNGTPTAPPSEGSAFLPGEPSTNGHRKWPRCVRSSFGLRPRRECWLNLVEKCGFGPRAVVIVGLAHFMSGQFAFRQLVSSARGRCVEDRIIGASALSAAFECVLDGAVSGRFQAFRGLPRLSPPGPASAAPRLVRSTANLSYTQAMSRWDPVPTPSQRWMVRHRRWFLGLSCHNCG